MCGIVGYVGHRSCLPILIEGIKRLEYRGYDSAGVAVQSNGALKVVKAAGKIRELEARLAKEPLSGTAGEMAVTVAWDLSWYQYRVSPDSGQPVRLERRGHELDELEDSYKDWNAHVEDEGRLVPDIARL